MAADPISLANSVPRLGGWQVLVTKMIVGEPEKCMVEYRIVKWYNFAVMCVTMHIGTEKAKPIWNKYLPVPG